MNRVVTSILVIVVMLFTPFAYFWIRDVRPLNEDLVDDACAPYDLQVDTERFSIEITWKTSKECVSYLKYTQNVTSSNWETVIGQNELDLGTDHKARITELKPATNYFVGIVSDGKLYGENGIPLRLRTSDQ